MSAAAPVAPGRADRPARTRHLFWRAARLRCPVCAGGPLFHSWFTMRDACPGCGLQLERHEPGYYLGAMSLNLGVAEGTFALAFGAAVWATWPDVPWDPLLYASVALMVLAPVAFYPFSKILWLALDLRVRPATREDLRQR